MTDERQEFSRRLAEAMRVAGHEPRPSVLSRLFNTHYRGRSISFQSASRWLRGRAIPGQDKLQVLSRLLSVEPHALRYGGGRHVAEPRLGWPAGIGKGDQQVIAAFLALPPRRRELVGELVQALAGDRDRKP
jgi:transcriptional regulator with XRE-family HTH domain